MLTPFSACSAHLLSSFIDRTVVDPTQLRGRYDITLNASVAGNGPSVAIFSAIQDLGLQLETRQAPGQYVVVDKAEKIPSEN